MECPRPSSKLTGWITLQRQRTNCILHQVVLMTGSTVMHLVSLFISKGNAKFLGFCIELRDTGRYGFVLPANQITNGCPNCGSNQLHSRKTHCSPFCSFSRAFPFSKRIHSHQDSPILEVKKQHAK